MILLTTVLIVQAVVGRVQPCSDPVDQSTMTRCAWEDYRRADAVLNRQWAETLARYRQQDRDNPDAKLPSFTATLIKAQRAWVLYRDATCAVEGQYMRGGSGEPQLQGECLTRMTRERIDYLKKVGP